MPTARAAIASDVPPAAGTAGRDAEVPPEQRILLAAIAIFSEHGFDGATLRQITDRARVNLAAVNYYYRSKDELVRRVLERLMGPIQARLAALEACEAAAAPGFPTLEAVIEAMVRPTVTLSRDESGGRPLIRLLLQVRALPRPETARFFQERVDPIVERFVAAIGRARPELARADIFWRYNFALGALMQVLTDSDPSLLRLARQSGGLCDTGDDEAITGQLVAFIVAGFEGPPAGAR
ncbi:TetR family transcriptional regulator [Roseomonas sp. NAR14]|uniref:TetR family transcriptional regulator n=1 Tax=Roseomonas acroporae TaxID=2937791 RepID=A0A9X2BVU1_9PROT|nr:TetR/AcrR family transcriptional regulator [Roseomonas acroporae]MCK8786988.1 TetR family transcriptional regulator [Roseomonas acroporae]